MYAQTNEVERESPIKKENKFAYQVVREADSSLA
jgi:hypothetical protein